MCPLVAPDGRFDDDVNYPGCLLTEPSDGGKSIGEDSTSSGDDEGMSTTTLVGIIGGVVVLGLVGVIVVMLKKKPQPKKRSGPKPLTDLPAPEPPAPVPMMEAAEVADEPDTPQEEGSSETDGEITVGSWEELPGGDYLDPDEEGTVWFRANNGDNWYQNADGSWTKWQD